MKISIFLILLGSLYTAAQKSSPTTDPTTETTTTNSAQTGATASSSAETNAVSDTTSPTNRPDNTEKSRTTLSYEEWKKENEKRLDEKFDQKRREYQDKANNDLMRDIQSALARPDLSAAKKSELNYVYTLLKRAAEVNEAGVKKAAYDEALDVVASVLSQ